MARHPIARAGLFVTLLALLLLALPGGAARAEDPVPIHAGTHRGYGRLVFDFPRWVGWHMTRHDDVVRLRFSRAMPFGPDPALPPNVLELSDGPGWARVRIAKGAKIRRMRVGARLVLDVLAPGKTPPAGRAPLVSRREGADRVSAPAALTAAGTAGTGGSPGPARAGHGQAGHGEAGHGQPGRNAAAPPSGAPFAAGTAASSSIPPPTAGTEAGGGATGPAPPAAAPAAMARGAPSHRAPSPGAPAGTPAGGPPGTTPEAASTAVTATPVFGPAGAAPGPVALAAQSVATPQDTPPSSPGAILVPFEAGVGAAAFRRADRGVVVFDAARPIDLSALRGTKIFGTATVHLLPRATEIELTLPPGARLTLHRQKAGWLIALGGAAARASRHRTIRPVAQAGSLHLAAPMPGHAVSLLDPVTGAPLLVGTERGPGAGLSLRRRAPEFALLRSWRGVVVEALSDRLRLRPVPDGFVLSLAGGSLAIGPGGAETAGLTDAALLTRRFRFPDLPAAALARRLRRELDAAALRPPLARGRPLRRAATTMIALGMGAEAGALLHLAATEDPREARAPVHAGLVAVAALLAGQPGRAGGIEAPALSGSDEVSLWRAVRAAELAPGSPRAAQLFAATAPLILTYPLALRHVLLPLAAETMVRGGELAPAARLIASRPGAKRLGLARAMLAAAQGHSAAALRIYDRLAQGADRLVRIRAATRAVALRLVTKAIGPARAAAALDRLLDAWRGGRRELVLREHLAALRATAGQWRRSLRLLRHSIADFPADRASLRLRMRHIFAAMLKDPRFDKTAPLRFVSLLDANADLLPTGRAGEAIAARLARRLLALDLPDRAAPVLARLMRTAPAGVARAGFGATLARLRLEGKDPVAARAALAASAAAALPPALAARRAILDAEAVAAEGQRDQALAALRAVGTTAADRAGAAIAERAGDWPAAEAALRAATARSLSATGPLDPAQQRLLLRLATATVRAGDAAGIAALRGQQPRMGSGKLADMFRLLTGPGVRSLADLPQAGTEAALAGSLGTALKALR